RRGGRPPPRPPRPRRRGSRPGSRARRRAGARRRSAGPRWPRGFRALRGARRWFDERNWTRGSRSWRSVGDYSTMRRLSGRRTLTDPHEDPSMKQLRFWVPFALSAAIPVAAFAQQDFSKIEITSEQLAPDVYMLRGAGGNIGVCVGPDGAFLIDDQFAPLTDKIKAAVAKLSDKPVRFVLNTHWHG